MCYGADDDLSIEELENRYNRRPKRQLKMDFGDFKFTKRKKGVNLPKMMVITNAEPDLIQPYNWGMFPRYPGMKFNPTSFLNARSEELEQKKTWQPIMNQRCLVPVGGFYEYQHIDKFGNPDPLGKDTKLFKINAYETEIYTLGGLWKHWVDESTGEEIKCFTILTKEATGIMREIHNKTLRMPIILDYQDEEEWLMGGEAKREVELEAIPWSK